VVAVLHVDIRVMEDVTAIMIAIAIKELDKLDYMAQNI
jgi:hypothetical protein